MRVEIRRKAFDALILSTVEVFKKEASGLMLGRLEDGVVIITTCVPCQASKRTVGSFDFNKRRLNRMLRVARHLYARTKSEFLGYYHSHPEYGRTKYKPKPSRADRDWIYEESGGLIFLIIAIHRRRHKMKWHLIRNRRILVGTMDKYRFDISVYYRVGKRFKRAKIVFPEFLK